MTLSQSAAILATVVLAAGVVFQLLLAAGLPLGHAAWGGKYRVLPPKLRWASLASTLPLLLAAWVVLSRAGLISPGPESTPVRVATWVFAGFFALNTLGNLASKSPVERRIMTPATIVLVVTFVITALAA